MPRKLRAVLGRGSAKTTDFQAERLAEIIFDMPGAPLVWVADTFSNLTSNILPGVLEGLERKGLHEGVHYVIEKEPPTYTEKEKEHLPTWLKPHFWKPFNRLVSYKRTIIFHTGTNIRFGSLDRPSTLAGSSYVYVFGDEVKYFKEEKIANLMKKKQGRRPLLVACDVIRPAAIEQLQTLGESIGVEVFTLGVETGALETAKRAMAYAKEQGYDTVLFDTAGRLHIDEELMQELGDIKAFLHPDEILLTVDAMTGQDIVNVAQSFHDQLDVSGLVLTKLDGDSRGGGILSVRAITNVPVMFVGLGEKIDDLDVFHPSRMADRILGMGDVLTLIEQAQDKMDMEASKKTADRLMQGTFTLDDMLVQYQQIKKMGSLGGMMKMIPASTRWPARSTMCARRAPSARARRSSRA